MRALRFILMMAGLMLLSIASLPAQSVVIGSKKFTESYVLGEIAKAALAEAGIPSEHKQGMGGTIILWGALKKGEITLYPEYTGTIVEEILKSKEKMTLAQIRDALKPMKIGALDELGFNNTYALCMRRAQAEQLGIQTISDLRNHPDLKVGVTHEFLERQDGWKPLSSRYGLAMRDVKAVDHGIGYLALKKGEIDLKDAYSTDAKIAEYDLVTLQDDLEFFPQYKAVFLYRLDANPEVATALHTLSKTIDETRMIQLNAAAEQSKNYTRAAALYFSDQARQKVDQQQESWVTTTLKRIVEHLSLVTQSMILAILVGIPLGIFASRRGFVSQAIFSLTGVIQTIPSLALLALLVSVPFLGLTPKTAILALFLYSLLPITRNTATGLQDIPASLRESAEALGLPPAAQLFKIYLPLASRSILAGIKTSAIINVGTATLAALIGAGGLGQPIISGLNLNDYKTILQGAIPTALLALLIQAFFDGLDRVIIPKGLRLRDLQGRSG